MPEVTPTAPLPIVPEQPYEILTTVEQLRTYADTFNSTMSWQRKLKPVRLRGTFDLGAVGVRLGDVASNNNISWGFNLTGDGCGHITPAPQLQSFAPTTIRYSGTDTALDLRGMNTAEIGYMSVIAPNGTAVRLSASSIKAAWAQKCTFKQMIVHGKVGFYAFGTDPPTNQSPYGSGQVDGLLLDRVHFNNCEVAYRQNSQNTVGTLIQDCDVVYKKRGIDALAGSIRFTNGLIGDTQDAATDAVAFYATHAQFSITDTSFETDKGQIIVAEPHLGTWASTADRIVGCSLAYGVTSGIGIAYQRAQSSITFDTNSYGMRGASTWKIRVDPTAILSRVGHASSQIIWERI